MTSSVSYSSLVEVKWKDDSFSPQLAIFANELPSVRKIQLVKELSREKTFPDGAEIRNLAKWLVDW
ncbi:MAG: hypothetical protein R3A13_05710 [Bdellovibrionota bacterium]